MTRISTQTLEIVACGGKAWSFHVRMLAQSCEQRKSRGSQRLANRIIGSPNIILSVHAPCFDPISPWVCCFASTMTSSKSHFQFSQRRLFGIQGSAHKIMTLLVLLRHHSLGYTASQCHKPAHCVKIYRHFASSGLLMLSTWLEETGWKRGIVPDKGWARGCGVGVREMAWKNIEYVQVRHLSDTVTITYSSSEKKSDTFWWEQKYIKVK